MLIMSNQGIELWNKSKKIIPGGTQLLSKRSEMFLPEHWPSYYKSAKGVEIIDLDGNRYIDMSLMGVGCCILGYADEDVNREVKKVIDQCSMCTLNSKEEVELAETLIRIHPWADKVRFARSGGEISTLAIRLARAYTKKDKIAFCGYHGWHDWYLASNLSDNKNLDGHLLPGLNPLGVPRGLINTSIPFEYNNIGQLYEIVENNDVGTIIIEPLRHDEPKDKFLEKIKKVSEEIGAVLIFDEISIGWRNNLGGIHLKYNVTPDMAIFAKAMSNGYPMAAVIGRGEIMDYAQKSFISSTYWTERIGPTASLATIHKLEKSKAWEHIANIGQIIGENWDKIAKERDLDITIKGPYSLITFFFNYNNSQELKTLFIQEMLERGYLASNSVYVSYSHTEELLTNYFESIDDVFRIIKNSIEKDNVKTLLKGPVAHSGFKRLT